MVVRSAQVRDFKSITDSDEVRFDESVTCLVGKNESGKTAFLEAVYRSNPLPTGHRRSFAPLYDYPRVRYARERDSAGDVRVIQVNLELEDDDIAAIEAEFGAGIVTKRAVTVWQKYDNTRVVSIEIYEAAACKKLLVDAGLDRKLVGDVKTVSELTTALQGLSEAPPAALELLTRLDGLDVRQQIRTAVIERRPGFHYFDEYSVLPGRVSIPRLQEMSEDDLDSGERTALALLRLAGVDTADFAEDDYEARKAALEAASNEISNEVFAFWSQNRDLRVELDLDFKAPVGPHGEAPPFLEIRINNLRHGVTLNVGERSRGFLWFFSFLAAFSEYRDSDDAVVLLLDEPGLGLHASAQADLLRYIDERLAPTHQVVYTTHSPFMVDPTRFERVRTVEDVDGAGTKIGEDVLGTSSDTLFPLQAALGYELAQTLFVGRDNLVVEGPADLLYLTVMSEHVRSLGRTPLDPRWTIVPVGGLDKIPTFVALLGAHLNVAVVLDVAAGGSQKVNSLVAKGVIDAKNLFPLNTITGAKEADIEDLFEPAFYLRLVRESGAANVTMAKLAAGIRIVQRIEQAVGAFDHYRPARHLLENQVNLLPKIDDATLDRFERLFTEVNAGLS